MCRILRIKSNSISIHPGPETTPLRIFSYDYHWKININYAQIQKYSFKYAWDHFFAYFKMGGISVKAYIKMPLYRTKSILQFIISWNRRVHILWKLVPPIFSTQGVQKSHLEMAMSKGNPTFYANIFYITILIKPVSIQFSRMKKIVTTENARKSNIYMIFWTSIDWIYVKHLNFHLHL